MNILKKIFGAKVVETNEAAEPEGEYRVDLCVGCYWKAIGRFQKCSTCRRNQHMKDNYIRAEVDETEAGGND